MLYKNGGPHEIHGGHFDTLIVESEDELDAAIAKGWSLTTDEATELKVNAPAPAAAADPAPPTPGALSRDEMKAKAAELGLVIAHNISNIKLAELLDAAIAKG